VLDIKGAMYRMIYYRMTERISYPTYTDMICVLKDGRLYTATRSGDMIRLGNDVHPTSKLGPDIVNYCVRYERELPV
jgi:hypothetical protein